jgi:AbiV family abortive infection protein
MEKTDEKWWQAVGAATKVNGRLVSSTSEFNQACDHIVALIEDAATLLDKGSYSTAVFLAITAIEETAKVHISIYRTGGGLASRKGDPMYNHRTKHLLALGPTLAMGSRLQAAIGDDRLHEMILQARNGAYVRLREAAIYLERVNEMLVVPKSAISKTTARELLLLSIEAFDDGLVGYSEHTYACAIRTDEIFKKWAA